MSYKDMHKKDRCLCGLVITPFLLFLVIAISIWNGIL